MHSESLTVSAPGVVYDVGTSKLWVPNSDFCGLLPNHSFYHFEGQATKCTHGSLPFEITNIQQVQPIEVPDTGLICDFLDVPIPKWKSQHMFRL